MSIKKNPPNFSDLSMLRYRSDSFALWFSKKFLGKGHNLSQRGHGHMFILSLCLLNIPTLFYLGFEGKWLLETSVVFPILIVLLLVFANSFLLLCVMNQMIN